MALPHEEKPLGLQIPAVPHGAEIPAEPPDVAARALSVAARLLAGGTTFFFLSFLFAYFYLRSLNVEHMWHPAHVKPDQALGAAFIVCLLISVISAIAAGRGMKAGAAGWLTPGIASVAFGLIAVILQCIEFTAQKFGPTDGSYASVFCTWLSFYMIAVLATMFWLETHVASELRARREPASGVEGDIKDPDRLIEPGLDAAVFYWSYLGAIGLITYVVLYLL